MKTEDMRFDEKEDLQNGDLRFEFNNPRQWKVYEYNTNYKAFIFAGRMYCTSSNDTDLLDAWSKQRGTG